MASEAPEPPRRPQNETMTTWEALADAAGRNYIRKLDRADLEHAGDVPAREAAYAATLCELVEALGIQDPCQSLQEGRQVVAPPAPRRGGDRVSVVA